MHDAVNAALLKTGSISPALMRQMALGQQTASCMGAHGAMIYPCVRMRNRSKKGVSRGAMRIAVAPYMALGAKKWVDIFKW